MAEIPAEPKPYIPAEKKGFSGKAVALTFVIASAALVLYLGIAYVMALRNAEARRSPQFQREAVAVAAQTAADNPELLHAVLPGAEANAAKLQLPNVEGEILIVKGPEGAWAAAVWPPETPESQGALARLKTEAGPDWAAYEDTLVLFQVQLP
ncbi:MAG: hypothetical protein RLY93_09760 [Sumerlaeia bacterium]